MELFPMMLLYIRFEIRFSGIVVNASHVQTVGCFIVLDCFFIAFNDVYCVDDDVTQISNSTRIYLFIYSNHRTEKG